MAAVLVDTNVLIDVATADASWFEWSAGRLQEALTTGGLAIDAMIYGEFSIYYDSIERVEQVLAPLALQRLVIPFEAAFLAGKAFRRYRERGGTRKRPLPDFYIGAHAAVSGLTLLTRDPRRYRQYFPRLELIAPP